MDITIIHDLTKISRLAGLIGHTFNFKYRPCKQYLRFNFHADPDLGFALEKNKSGPI